MNWLTNILHAWRASQTDRLIRRLQREKAAERFIGGQRSLALWLMRRQFHR